MDSQATHKLRHHSNSPTNESLRDLSNDDEDNWSSSSCKNDSESVELDSRTSEDEKLLSDSGHDADVEAQSSSTTKTLQTPAEYTVSTTKKLTFLALYFVLNLGLTLSNKALLQTASFPWLLTFSHTTATSIGCAILLATGNVKLTKLSWRDHLKLAAFSVLFTMNIAVSNVSLALVSVPFHQIMRSTCPVVTVLIYRFVYARTYSTETYLSLAPLIIGVALATFGDYYFTIIGFLLTLLGVVLASTKTVATNRLMTGNLKLSAMEVLLRMSPLAAMQCLVGAGLSGEITQAIPTAAADQRLSDGRLVLLVLGVLGNAAAAFALNLVSFQTNKVAGALTISVCGNVKQLLTIVLGLVLFRVEIGVLNGVGMVVAVLGAVGYSKVELDRKRDGGKK